MNGINYPLPSAHPVLPLLIFDAIPLKQSIKLLRHLLGERNLPGVLSIP
ncbi:hypothetical protein GCM10009104_18740 [Marinobacterium maritimum]|uniref:Uncharacterized protein n=1 Tax=Marinobacterium maritimum TaxID=500162 RepID=A0ABP3TC41_9GAMM